MLDFNLWCVRLDPPPRASLGSWAHHPGRPRNEGDRYIWATTIWLEVVRGKNSDECHPSLCPISPFKYFDARFNRIRFVSNFRFFSRKEVCLVIIIIIIFFRLLFLLFSSWADSLIVTDPFLVNCQAIFSSWAGYFFTIVKLSLPIFQFFLRSSFVPNEKRLFWNNFRHGQMNHPFGDFFVSAGKLNGKNIFFVLPPHRHSAMSSPKPPVQQMMWPQDRIGVRIVGGWMDSIWYHMIAHHNLQFHNLQHNTIPPKPFQHHTILPMGSCPPPQAKLIAGHCTCVDLVVGEWMLYKNDMMW